MASRFLCLAPFMSGKRWSEQLNSHVTTMSHFWYLKITPGSPIFRLAVWNFIFVLQQWIPMVILSVLFQNCFPYLTFGVPLKICRYIRDLCVRWVFTAFLLLSLKSFSGMLFSAKGEDNHPYVYDTRRWSEGVFMQGTHLLGLERLIDTPPDCCAVNLDFLESSLPQSWMSV